MQRYRVNYVLLIGLLAGTLVCSVTVYAVWRFQIGRNAGNLTARAEKAEEKGDLRGAIGLYRQYLTIRPNDPDVLAKHALAWRRLVERDDARMEDLTDAYQVIEGAVRRLPDNDDLRREMIDMLMSRRFAGREQDALEHLRIMLERNPDSTELQVLRARCLTRAGTYDQAVEFSYGLIGYDAETDSFDLEKAKAPHEVIVYRNLADMLRSRQDNPELADRVMDQVVAANPDSFEAFLQRGQYYLSNERTDLAEDDIRKAYELDPDDADVLFTLAHFEKTQEASDEAQKHLEAGVEKYPQDSRFYQQLAEVAMSRLNYEEALDYVNRGIAAVPPRDSLMLLWYKSDLQIRGQDVPGVKETIETMKSHDLRPDFIQWIEARVLLIQEQWYKASRALKEVRPLLTNIPEIRIQIDVQLGLCYEKLGQLELALESYDFALQRQPENDPAAMGRQRVLARLGREPVSVEQASWQQELQMELQKPEEERDWARIKGMMESVADRMKLSNAGQMLLDAEILLMQKHYKEARELLERAYRNAPDDLTIQRAAVRMLKEDPTQGPVKALGFLEDTVIRRFGDSPELRAEKADLLIAINDSNMLKEELEKLTENMEGWSQDQQVNMWYTMAAKYFQLGMRDDAQRCWLKVTELAPNDLPTRLMLFTLAHDANDDAGMQAAQEKILEVVRSKNDSTWQYTEARRLLSLYRRGQLADDALERIDELVKAAETERRDWHELHLLRAELAMMRGQADVALEHYQAASRLGRPHPAAIVQHVQLLVQRGRFAEAKIVVERLPEATRQQLLGQLYAEILFQTGAVSEAMDSAQFVIDRDPDSAVKQLWYGQLMARAAESNALDEAQRGEADTKAGEALRRAVDLGPGIQQAWLALVSYHVYHKDQANAEQALREAQLALSSEQLPVVLAKCYELMGRAFDAENLYRTAYEADTDNVVMARQLATFYLGPNNRLKRSERIAKATPLLNQILKAGAEGELEPNDPSLLWARRASAKLLADTKDYQNLLKAAKLLASNSNDGQLPIKDRLQMAQILAPRPEPISRLKAVALLEEAKEFNRLSLSAELILGNLYFMMGDWPKCQRQMSDVIIRYPNAAIARDSYIRMLLRKDAPNRTRRHLEKLIELAPNSLNTLELIATVYARLDRQPQAREALLRALPTGNDLSKLTDEQLPIAEKIADLLANELGDEETALTIYRFLASRNPNKALKLAEFLGQRRDVSECIELLDKVYNPEVAASIVQSGIRVLRARRIDVGDQFDAQLQQWIDRGLRENPGFLALKMQQAEFYEVQQDYRKATAAYRELLKRRDLEGRSRAIVLNNLSYLLALDRGSANTAEAMRLVREAVQILGPTADILDTRAVVFISQKRFEDAADDLELSLTENPTASKHFHMTVAFLGSSRNTDAMFHWDEALKLGLSRDTISPLEREQYDNTQEKIKELQATSARYEPGQPLGTRRGGGDSIVAAAR